MFKNTKHPLACILLIANWLYFIVLVIVLAIAIGSLVVLDGRNISSLLVASEPLFPIFEAVLVICIGDSILVTLWEVFIEKSQHTDNQYEGKPCHTLINSKADIRRWLLGWKRCVFPKSQHITNQRRDTDCQTDDLPRIHTDSISSSNKGCNQNRGEPCKLDHFRG